MPYYKNYDNYLSGKRMKIWSWSLSGVKGYNKKQLVKVILAFQFWAHDTNSPNQSRRKCIKWYSENWLFDQLSHEDAINCQILLTVWFISGEIMKRENWSWSLTGVKGLISYKLKDSPGLQWESNHDLPLASYIHYISTWIIIKMQSIFYLFRGDLSPSPLNCHFLTLSLFLFSRVAVHRHSIPSLLLLHCHCSPLVRVELHLSWLPAPRQSPVAVLRAVKKPRV